MRSVSRSVYKQIYPFEVDFNQNQSNSIANNSCPLSRPKDGSSDEWNALRSAPCKKAVIVAREEEAVISIRDFPDG